MGKIFFDNHAVWNDLTFYDQYDGKVWKMLL